jgi:tetratricopeptide (TPR) repeat protein
MEEFMLHQIEKISNIGFTIALILLLVLTPVGESFGNIFAQSQNECEEELKNAQRKMETGKFDEAIELITECLNKEGISNESKKQAYRLLGLTYIAKDYLGEARNAVGKLLDIVPNYQPDPDQDPPSFVDIVEEQIAERSQTVTKVETKLSPADEGKSDKTLWWWIGGGAVVALVAVILIAAGGGDDDGNGDTPPTAGLPDPPDLP